MSIRNEKPKSGTNSIDSIEKLAVLVHDSIIEHRRDAIVAQIVQIPA